MPHMARRRKRRSRKEGAAVLRLMAILARGVMVVLLSVAVGYAFYFALDWVAAEAARR